MNRPLFRPAVAAIVACLFGLTAVVTTADAYTGPVESANARYVVATYQQLLGRDPDDASLDFYLGKVAAGGDTSRQMIAEALLYGPEASAREVDRAYRKILERPAEPGGRIYWTNHLQVYDVLDLRVLLFSSDEYFRRAGDTNQDWVRALYLDILGRNPETAGLRYWTAEADRGTERALIVAGFYLGRESLGRRTDDYYRLVLQRPASAVERAAGASVIAAEGERSLYARLWASDEVFEQFFDAVWSP
ncbi:MAG: DUF4214 domain-containing protein [Acidimicrobiia bacterium]|nr:DUF4214 domain-containing protein [Acidimicrobiia bacterium]